jgi:putative heme transporter
MLRRSNTRPVRIDITAASLVRIGAFIFGVWLLTQLWDVVLLITIALILAGTLSPFVAFVERRMSRGWAVATVIVTLALAVGLIALVTIAPLFSQAGELVQQAPDLFHRATDYLYRVPALSKMADRARTIDVGSLLTTYGGRALKVSTAVAGVIGYAVTAIVLSIYLLADPAQAKGVLFAMVPRSYHVRTARILLELETIVGGYMRGQAITSAAMTAFTCLLLWICKVPNPLPLAVFAGLTDVIPMIGGILAVAPAVLSALPQGPGTALIVAASMFAYQEFENRVLAPRIYGRALRLSPAAVLIALLVGGNLMGILGALLALPIAAGILMIITELRLELPGETPVTDREHEDEESQYATRAAGASAEQSAIIAESIVTADAAPVVATGKSGR